MELNHTQHYNQSERRPSERKIQDDFASNILKSRLTTEQRLNRLRRGEDRKVKNSQSLRNEVKGKLMAAFTDVNAHLGDTSVSDAMHPYVLGNRLGVFVLDPMKMVERWLEFMAFRVNLRGPIVMVVTRKDRSRVAKGIFSQRSMKTGRGGQSSGSRDLLVRSWVSVQGTHSLESQEDGEMDLKGLDFMTDDFKGVFERPGKSGGRKLDMFGEVTEVISPNNRKSQRKRAVFRSFWQKNSLVEQLRLEMKSDLKSLTKQDSHHKVQTAGSDSLEGLAHGSVSFHGDDRKRDVLRESSMTNKAVQGGVTLITTRWLNGLMTNYPILRKRVLSYRVTPSHEIRYSTHKRFTIHMEPIESLRASGQRPALVLFWHAKDHVMALREVQMAGIPTACVVNSSFAEGDYADFLLPGGDSSMEIYLRYMSLVKRALEHRLDYI